MQFACTFELPDAADVHGSRNRAATAPTRRRTHRSAARPSASRSRRRPTRRRASCSSRRSSATAASRLDLPDELRRGYEGTMTTLAARLAPPREQVGPASRASGRQARRLAWRTAPQTARTLGDASRRQCRERRRTGRRRRACARRRRPPGDASRSCGATPDDDRVRSPSSRPSHRAARGPARWGDDASRLPCLRTWLS